MIPDDGRPRPGKRPDRGRLAPRRLCVFRSRRRGRLLLGRDPRDVVILGPGHREIDSLFAIQGRGSWLTPARRKPHRGDLAARIVAGCPLVEEDEKRPSLGAFPGGPAAVHPILREDAAIVPICVSLRSRATMSSRRSAGRWRRRSGPTAATILIVASTDMSHYVSQKTAEKKDMLAIRKILALDARRPVRDRHFRKDLHVRLPADDGGPRRGHRPGRRGSRARSLPDFRRSLRRFLASCWIRWNYGFLRDRPLTDSHLTIGRL